MAARSPRLAKRRADDYFRYIVRARGYCERCGTQDPHKPLECAHIIRRRFSWTRTQEDNAWALCARCHQTVDMYPDQLLELVARTIGIERYRELVQLSLCRDKFDWFAEADRLREAWKAIR